VVFYNAVNVLYQVLDETLCTSQARHTAAVSPAAAAYCYLLLPAGA
jgi:hypothetical protein